MRYGASRTLSILVIISLATSVVAGLVQAEPALAAPGWWNTDWHYRLQLTFNNSGQSEDLVDFPVLVKLTNSNSSYSHCRNDGGDIRFVDADDATQLEYHFEKWNYNGESWIWVKVPRIDGGSSADYIWLYYGNSTATDMQDEEDTYDNNFVAVWHLADTIGAPPTQHDSASNNDGTPTNTEGGDFGVTGQVNGAEEFDGTDDHVLIANEANFDFRRIDSFTLEAWVRTTSDRILNIITKMADSPPHTGYQLIKHERNVGDPGGGNKLYFFLINDYPDVMIRAYGSTDITDGEWHYVAVTYDGSSNASGVQIYVDATAETMTPTHNTLSSDDILNNLQLQISGREGSNSAFNGTIDEVRISDVARSADWIEAQYLSMTDGFITYGSEQVPSRGVPAFPSLYLGMAAAVGAGILAYAVRRRVVAR